MFTIDKTSFVNMALDKMVGFVDTDNFICIRESQVDLEHKAS